MAYHQAPTGSRGFSGFPKAPNHIWPCHVIAYICANTGTSALTFLNYDFGKGQYFFIPRKVSKVKHFLEGFGHPNLMNPFEYGKSLPGKSFPKRIGTLTPPNPKIFRRGSLDIRVSQKNKSPNFGMPLTPLVFIGYM